MTEKLGNGGALGLIAFALTTFCLMVHNTGLYGMNSMIIAMGLAYGGMMQIVAGAMEWRRGNTFGTVAFLSYGAFWISFCLMEMLPLTGLMTAPDTAALAAYMFGWGLFTGLMFIGTLKSPIVIRVVFALLTIVFLLLALNNAIGVEEMLTRVISVFGIALALSALYAGIGEVLNEVHGKEILPLGTKKN
ncbi:MAG: acetate uptake transporter [Candidatus Methanomethylophilaceae archaeon]|nr:acetate uptake transporter [Candidatus Methanomethylophilaceae archaeon]